MKKRKYNGEIVETSEPARTCWVTVRMTPEERDKLGVLVENFNYRSVSSFVRDLLFRKRIESKKVVVRLTDRTLRDKINEVTFQIRKIGVNYNQIAATYQAQAKMTRPDGKPFLGTRRLDEMMTRLMQMTGELRDEVAVLIDTVERYTLGN